MEEFLARKYLWIDGKAKPFFYRFSKWCRPLCPNGTEHNGKNYGKKLPFYGRTTERNSKLLFVSYCIYDIQWIVTYACASIVYSNQLLP